MDRSRELMTTREAAALLMVSPATLRKWRERGQGPKYSKYPGLPYMYLRADVERYLIHRRRGGVA